MLNKLQRYRLIRPNFNLTKHEKPKANIVDLYQKLIGGKVKVSGNATIVKCCFHDEHTPSLALYPQTSSYYCFGCSKHGDIFNFVEEVLHCDFKEALEVVKQNGN